MRSKTRSALAIVVVALIIAAFSTSCGNSNFFPSQTAIISMTVSPASNVVPPGSTASFAATGTLGNNQTQDVTSQVTWTSSNDSIATVSAGVVTGVALGEVTITASANHITITAPLVVSSMSSITVSPSSWSPTSAGATQQLTATGSDGTPVTNYVAWTSSDTTCAIVSSTGLVTFEGSATDSSCTITATIGSFTGQTNVTGTII
jgi:uncharacterized protein YjdB